MIDEYRRRDAVIVQNCWQVGPFSDMLRLTYQRHVAYAFAHQMEYWHMVAVFKPEMYPGGWGKIWLIRQALEAGYKHVFWVDADAAIVDMEADLRDGLPDGKLIGACEHWAEDWFPKFDIPRHYNVGVLFLRNDPLTIEFMDDWLSRYPGHSRWLDQGVFNEMVKEDKYKGIFAPMDAKWNATFNVNMVEHPYIQGWHGVMPESKRFTMMKEVFKDDHLKYRV